MRVSGLIISALAASALLAQPAGAQEIPVANSDFEAGWYAAEGEYLPTHIYGTPGWGWSGGSGTGRWNPTADQMSDQAAHGVVGYATGVIGSAPSPAFLAQVLSGVVIEANTRYTLTVDVGNTVDLSLWGYNFGLIAVPSDGESAPMVLAQAYGGMDPSFPAGQFTTVSLNYETADSGPAIGGSLIVALGGLGRGAAYDNVRVTATSLAVSAVPEPATWAMMLFGFGAAGTALRRQRKTSAQPA